MVIVRYSDTDFSKLDKSDCIIFFMVFDKNTDYTETDIGDVFITQHKGQYKELVSRYGVEYVHFMHHFDFDTEYNKEQNDMYNVYKSINENRIFTHCSGDPEYYSIGFPQEMRKLFYKSGTRHPDVSIEEMEPCIRSFRENIQDDIEFRDSVKEFKCIIDNCVKRRTLPIYIDKNTRISRNKCINRLVSQKHTTRQNIIYQITGDPSHNISLVNSDIVKFIDSIYPMNPNVLNYTEWQHLLNIPDNFVFDTDISKSFSNFSNLYKTKGLIPYKKQWGGIMYNPRVIGSIDSIKDCKFIIASSASVYQELERLLPFVKVYLVNCDYKPPVATFKFSPKIFNDKPSKYLCIYGDVKLSADILPECEYNLKRIDKDDIHTLDDNDKVMLIDTCDPCCPVVRRCIQRHVPMYIKRNETSTLILGSEYPLYYDSLYELIILLEEYNKQLFQDAYAYICDLDYNRSTMYEFVDSLNEIISSF